MTGTAENRDAFSLMLLSGHLKAKQRTIDELIAALRKAEEHIRITSGDGETDIRAFLNDAIAKAGGKP